jgi:hypothetical protein
MPCQANHECTHYLNLWPLIATLLSSIKSVALVAKSKAVLLTTPTTCHMLSEISLVICKTITMTNPNNEPPP